MFLLEYNQALCHNSWWVENNLNKWINGEQIQVARPFKKEFLPQDLIEEVALHPRTRIQEHLDWWQKIFGNDKCRKYHLDKEHILDEVSKSIWQQFAVTIASFHGDLKGKTILDLGSGSMSGYSELNSSAIDDIYNTHPDFYHWQPWYCRVLAKLGAKPIALDIGQFENENFEAHQVNLLNPHVLDFLPDSSIDLANAHQLFNSPKLCRTLGYEESTEELGKRSPVPGELLAKNLLPQLRRVVKPMGHFVYKVYSDEIDLSDPSRRFNKSRWPFNQTTFEANNPNYLSPIKSKDNSRSNQQSYKQLRLDL